LKTVNTAVVWSLLGIVLGGGATYLLARIGKQTSLTSLSPDGEFLVRLRSLEWGIDRNIEVWIEAVHGSRKSLVFDSPDEDFPAGTERILWSKDGRQFVLIGQHFTHLSPTARLPGGEFLYLLVDVENGAIRCNSTAQEKLPSFSTRDLPPMREIWTPQPDVAASKR
jgi:hypothetical protein